MQEVGKLIPAMLIATIICWSAFLILPTKTDAAFSDADTFCNVKCMPFWQKKPMQPCVMACQDTTNTGVTTGKCNPMPPGKCIGTGFNSPGGDMKGIGDMGKFLEQALGMAQKLMEMAKKGGGGGGSGSGSGGGGTGYNPGPLYPTCVHNPATNTVSPIPCTGANGSINYGTSAESGWGTAGSIGGSTADTLLKALNGETGTDTNTNTNSNSNSNNTSVNASSTSDTNTGTTQTKVIIQGEQGSLQPSQQGILQGDIVVGGSGGMLYVRSRDPQNNTEVAGFYGGSTFGQQQSSGLIGGMCGTRPWSQGILGGLIPASFFDNLCQRFGYQVGIVPVSPGGGGNVQQKRPVITITQNPVPRPATTTSPTVQPEVDIWANPPSVRLGTRTYIFWNSRGVDSCIEAGPNFSHNTLSGGASTVPLSDASTFTIECKTADGQVVRDSVRVNLAL